MKDMAATATNFASIFNNEGTPPEFDAVREQIEIRTGGDLDCWQLDKLTDLTIAKMRAA